MNMKLKAKKRKKKVSKKEFIYISNRKKGSAMHSKIIESDKYRFMGGEKIMFKQGKRFIACDNSTNDAWTEEFKSYKKAKKYLLGDYQNTKKNEKEKFL